MFKENYQAIVFLIWSATHEHLYEFLSTWAITSVLGARPRQIHKQLAKITFACVFLKFPVPELYRYIRFSQIVSCFHRVLATALQSAARK